MMKKKFIHILFLFTLFFIVNIKYSFCILVGGDVNIKIPLVITKNEGVINNTCKYFIRSGSSNLYFYPNKVTYQFVKVQEKKINSKNATNLLEQFSGKVDLLNMEVDFLDANPKAEFEEDEKLASKTNYFTSTDKTKWKTGLSDFKTLVYKNIYKNIDVKYYSYNEKIKYDFVISPGGNIGDIKLKYSGIDGLEINKKGDLVIHNKIKDIVENIPLAYQDINGERKVVQVKYKIKGKNVASFEAENYDKNYQLVIDPALFYSTLVGGTGDDQFVLGDMARDNAGNIYCTGWTSSFDFPTTPGAYSTIYSNGGFDAFAFKLNKDGSSLIYSSYFGGAGLDGGCAIDIDNSTSEAYVTGFTYGSFPTTPGAYQPVSNATPVAADVFALKLNSTGSTLVYSTLIGGAEEEISSMLKADASGNVYIVGKARNTLPFPLPGGPAPYQAANAGDFDGFVCVLNSNGTALLSSTYVGGTLEDQILGLDIGPTMDVYLLSITRGNFPVTPGAFATIYNGGAHDVVVSKLNATLSSLIYSGYLGGTGDDVCGSSIRVDLLGNAYVTGTASSGFPTTTAALSTTFNGGVSDAFVVKVNSTGSALDYSTYLGGPGDDGGFNIDINDAGEAYLTGFCEDDFPLSNCPYDDTYNGGTDVFIAKLNASGNGLIYSTYFGGTSYDRGSAIIGHADTVYVVGETKSNDFPTSPGAFDQTYNGLNNDGSIDVFALKLLLDVSPVAAFSQSISDMCLTDTVVFKNLSTGATSYRWDFGDGNGSSVLDTSYVYSAPGTYYVQLIANNTTCADTIVDTVVVNIKPVLTAISDTSICAGQTILLTSSGGSAYEWSGGATDTTQNISVSPSVDTDYYVLTKNGECKSEQDTITVKVYSIPNLSLTGNPNLCRGDTAILTSASTDSVTYQWSGGGISDITPEVKVNPAINTSYTITVTDTNGCINFNSIDMVVVPYPVFSTAGNGTNICMGESTILTAYGNSSFSYTWVETGEVTMSITVTPTDTTTYHLIVRDQFCSVMDSLTVIVHPIPVATISGPNLMCVGDIITIKATGGVTYFWGQYSSTVDSIQVSPPSDSTYMVIAQAYNCSSPPVFLDVMVSDTIVQAIINTTLDPCSKSILYTDGSLNARTYLWKFHDGTTASTPSITYTYDISGIYPVELVINRGVYCTDSTIYMADYWSNYITDVFIPNSFTPNFDGTNEKFEILGNVECFFSNLQIIDRWGKVIFETDKPGSEFWDGKVNMQAVPEGVYNYVLSGKKYTRSGSVTVIKAY